MASVGAEEDDGGIPLDIDNVHMLLQVEHEQIQKRTFTNWINAQLAKRCPPSFVSDLFSDLRDGSQLLDLLEVMSGQSMKRQRGRGVFQHRANIETALNFLKKKSIKLVNINIPDIIDGRPSIILGLIWTIILHCHIEELASALSFSSRHSSLDSLSSLDSWSGSSVPGSPVPSGRTSPLHRRFRISAKKALLMWVRDQCQKVNCSVSVRDFRSSWRSGEAFLAILCSLRPQLVDLSLVPSRSNQENLEEAFQLAERELHIPRLLEPQDVDVKDPEEKSIMTYVAQFLQYSNDMPAPDDHLQLFPLAQTSFVSPVNLPPHITPAIAMSPLRQVSPSERAQEVTSWLQQAYQELSEAWTATEKSSYVEKYQVFQTLAGSFTEQRRPVMTLFSAIRRSPGLNQHQNVLKTAWDRLEEELQRCKADLDMSLPPPLDSVVVWLQRAEAELTEGKGKARDNADAAKEARTQQDMLKTLNKDMSHYVDILDTYHNMDDSGNVIVPLEKFDEIKKRLTNIRVTAKYQGIKLEYQESRHTVLDLLEHISAKVQHWKAPYKSLETIHVLLQDWHETVEHQDLLLILSDALQNLKERADAYTSKAALGEGYQLVARQVKEAESEADMVTRTVVAARGRMDRVVSAWETYDKCVTALQAWLAQNINLQDQSSAVTTRDMTEWTSCQAQLNEAGNFLTEVTETSASLTLAEQLSKVNMQWAECMKKTMFEMSSEPSVGPCLQMGHSLTQEAGCLLRQPLEVASVPLKANREKLQLLKKKMIGVDLSSLSASQDFQASHIEKLQQTLPQMLAEAEKTCGDLQRAASKLEGHLAELDHWSTDALDCYNHIKEKMHRGHSALESATKVLISRGLQLVNQVVAEDQDLQNCVAGLQKTSPLQHLSTSRMQRRTSEAVSHCQEILGMFSSLGFKRQVGEFPNNQSPFKTACQTTKQPETGFLVVARTKQGDQTENIILQTQDPNQLSPQIPSHTPQQRTRCLQGWSKTLHMRAQDERDIATPHEVIQMMPQPLNEPTPHSFIHSHLAQAAEQAEFELLIQPQSFYNSHRQASSFSENDQFLPATNQTPVGRQFQVSSVLSKCPASSVAEEKERSSPSQTHSSKHKSRIPGQPNTLQSNKPPQPPVMVRSEVHSKAQSMARSRLEKARSRLQGRIQQAIKLFGGKQFSESQAKKKKRALKMLQPSMLEEFLGAVEGFGAFCSGSQLQDLMHLSDSVRKQWEDVRREMAAFVPILWCKIREGKPPFSVVQCGMHTNSLREATDQTDHDLLQHQAVTEGDASVEEGVESLRELCETLTPRKSLSLATDQLMESDEVQETQPSDKALPADGRVRQLGANTPLRPTDMSDDTQSSNNPPQEQSVDSQQQELVTTVSAQLHDDGEILQLQLQDNPAEAQHHSNQSRDCMGKKNQKPSLKAKEQLLKARLLHITESSQQTQSHIQALVRSNTVEKKQKADFTIIPETIPPQQEQLSEQGVLERMSTLEHTAAQMQSADDQKTLITEKLNQIIRKSVDISSLTLEDPTMLSDLKEIHDRLQAEIRKLSEQSTEEERQGPEATSLSPICQALHCSVHHLKQLRQQLGKVQSAAEALDRFLATVREVKAEIPTLLANQDPNRQKNEANWEQGRHSWQAAMQRLQAATEQSDSVDSSLNAVGMTLAMDGTNVTCHDVVKSLSKHIVEMEKKLVIVSKKYKEEELVFLEKVKILEREELNPMEICLMKIGKDFPQQSRAQEHSTPSGTEKELALGPKRSRLEGENYIKTQQEEAQTVRPDNVLRTKEQRPRRRSSQVKKEVEEKQDLVQRKAALLAALRETKNAAEQLRLQEPSLPALQHRTRALTELESSLAGLLSEVQCLRDATSQSQIPDEDQIREMEDLWEETTKAVTERLEQCCVLTELLKKFQSLHSELSGTLQKAENTISNQASYMGKNNLQRLHTKVQEIKIELNGLGDSIEEIRSICRQLHTRLRQIPECSSIPFESEADALMDRWLDLSERTDSYLENLHLGLTLWDGVLQLGTEVESWTNNTLAVFAQCPSFQTEDDIKSLKNEIATQEESIQHFHRRAIEIQSLLQSTERPLELQVVETQVRKKIEQLKELVSEAVDVYRQMVITKGQVTGRMEECLTSLQMIQESLLTLSGPSVAAVLAKLKELCLQLHTQDEQAESLQEDVRVITSIAGPESLLSLSVNEIQLQEKVRNTHQLFSTVEEQTEKNIQDLDRLQTETDHLEQWLHAAEEKTVKEEDLSHLQEEALQQSMRTELLSQLVSSLRSSNLHQVPLLAVSGKLMERFHNFHTHILGDLKEAQFCLNKDIEAFQGLAKSTQSWVEDLRQIVDSPLVQSPGSLSLIEQKLHCAQVVLNATTEGETRLEELRVTGDSLNCKLSAGDDLKRGIQETIQKTEEQWKNLLQSVEPHYSVLQADPQLTSIYLARRQEACCRVEELHHQSDQLSMLFPWPGTAERTQACLLAHQLWEEVESLRLTLTSLSEQRRELAERTSNSIWKDFSWDELDTRWSALMAELKNSDYDLVCRIHPQGVSSRLEEGVSNEQHFGQLLQDCHHKLTSLQERMSVCQAKKESSAGLNTDAPGLEALLQELTDIEKDILQLATLKDSIIVSSTEEAQASLSQQVSNLQNHKRVLENGIRENLGALNRNQRIRQVKEEASCLQTALKDLTKNVGDLCGTLEVLPDIIHLKQQWWAIKDLDTTLTELDTRVNILQRTRESGMMQEMLPADFLSTITALFKDLGSLTSIFQQKKKESAENTANKMTEIISQLHQWSQRIRAEPALLSQAALDEGLQLQQALYEVLSEQHFLLDCLGAKVTKELEESASSVLNESQTAVDTLSKCLVSHSGSDVQIENKELLSRSKTPLSPSVDETPSSATDTKENSKSCQNDNKINNNGTFHTSETSHPSTEPVTDMSEGLNVESDASKQDKAYVPMQKIGISVMGASRLIEKDDAFVPVQVPCSKISDVLHSKAQQESQDLTLPPQKVNLNLGSKAEKGKLDTSPQSSKHKTCSGENTEPLMLDLLPTLNQTLTIQEANTHPLQADTALTKPDNNSVSTAENMSEYLTTQPEATTDARCQDIDVTTKKVFTIVLDVEPMDMQRSENAGASSLDTLRCSLEAELCDAALTELTNTGFLEKKKEPFTTSVSPESDVSSCHLAAQSETFTEVTNAQQQEKHCEDVCWNTDKIFTIVLDMEPQPWDVQQSKKAGASSLDVLRCSQRVELCDAQLAEVSNEGFPEKISGHIPLIIPESDETDLKSHCLSSELNPLVLVNAELEEVTSASAKLPREERHITCELKHNEVLTSIISCNTVAECQLTHADATETTFPDVKQEKTADFCHSGKQTVGSVLFSVEDSVQIGDEQVTVADIALNMGTSNEETAKGENTEEANDTECIESKHSKVTERQDIPTLSEEESEWRLPTALEDMGVTQGQSQSQESMEPERTALCLSADLAATETTGGSTKSSKRRSTMQDILSEIQSLVERSNIINRTPHIDLNWYLKSSPGEPEIRLVRTVQRILACRYQPAQLSVTAMTKQLGEAEEYRRCVQQQVATMKNMSATVVCDPNALKKAEGQWSAALLDASATVQVKAAQLDQVKQYHRQMKITRAFLEVLAAEKEKMSLNALGSSALQAEKLHILLQTMERKKDIMEDLLRSSGQLSVHLSDAESSGALLAQLGDVQEEWRLLEGNIKRDLRHASNATCQSSLLLKEAEQLKAKCEALQLSIRESLDSKSALEIVCLTTDLKLYYQLYLHLQPQSDALISFTLGQKEKDEVKHYLQGLGTLLSVTKRKLDSFTNSRGGNDSSKINKQLRDLIVWAKQAENHISIGEKLALFPEEARIQIVEMKRFQTDILCRRSKMQVQVEEMKDVASDVEKEESDQVLRTVEDLYEAITDSLDHVLDTMKKNLSEREKLLCELASMDAWLAETYAKRDPCIHVENVSKADIKKLESELKSHKLATAEIETQLKLLEAMSESCKKIAIGLSPGESRYLVNRLSGLWTELDGLLAHEKATSWELKELIHERTCSDEELSTIQASLKQISDDLDQQKFPLTQDTLSMVTNLKHTLMEHQCQVQELQHCLETKRSPLLCSIGELQDRCKALSRNAFEQEKYLHLRRQMEESRDIVKGQIQHSQNKAVSVGERFRQCQTLLVGLPLIKTQCQEAADHLEAIAQELQPSELSSERERIHHTVKTLVSWENSVADDIKNLETKLLLGLRSSSELPALIEELQSIKLSLEGAKPVIPEEKAIDIVLQQYWVIWRNVESGVRVLEGLGQKEKINLKNYKDLYFLRDTVMRECHSWMVSLSQARESLKDYQWAAQGAIGFLHNAEATFLSAPGGFLDCTEEQRQTQQALETLEDGFQAHICHLVERVPQQPCLSRPEMEQLHISILSQLLVGRAVLEAQAHLRLETLQRCEIRQQSHRKCHEDIRQHLSGFEDKLSECASEQVASYDKCAAQQRKVKVLMEDIHCLAGKIEDLRAGCPMQGCGVGKDGELGALWRRWVSSRRGASLLMAHTEQRGEEWKDITTSMEQCCSFLTSLQAEVPDSSTVSFTQDEPQELLAQAEVYQAGLEQEQQALAFLEHRLEHALSLSTSQDFISPGPIGKTLVKIQENVRSLKERNLLVVAAAQEEEKERQQVQEEIGEVEKHTLGILLALEACSTPNKKQELWEDLSTQKAKLKSITDSVQTRYSEIPTDIGRLIQEVQLTLQRAEQKLMEKNSRVAKLASRVIQLGSGLEKVNELLEQRNPTVSEARDVLKHVWDELDKWHSSLMLLENEVQDLAEEHPDEAQLLTDQLTQPLQLYQNASQMAEHRTAFLSKIPACLQEFEDVLSSATCWLGEAQLWLSTPCSFTTARSLQNHAKSLQLVLEDSERISHTLQDFRPVLAEVSTVCDMSSQEERLNQTDQQVQKMQCNVLEPLEQLLQAVAMVEEMEAELKTIERNIPKIKAILSSVDISNITPMEHLHNREVILANVRSMRRTLEEIEKCEGELHIPQEAEESLLVFSRARLLLQPLEEMEQLAQQQASLLENKIREEERKSTDLGFITATEVMQELGRPPHGHFVQQEAFEVSYSEEEEDEEDESCHSSSSDTLTCSIPEDPEETLNLSDVQSEDMAEMKLLSDVKEVEPLTDQVSSETSSKGAKTSLLSKKHGVDTDFGSKNIESGLIALDSAGKTFSPKTVTTESLNTATIPPAEDQFATAATDQRHELPRHETSQTVPQIKCPQAAEAVEDTRLIPSRPITPFTSKRASDEFLEEEVEDLCLSTAPHPDLDTSNRLKMQREVNSSNRRLVEGFQQPQEFSEVPISLAECKEDDKESERWSQLHSQISKKLITLTKIKEEHQSLISADDGGKSDKVPEKELISTGSTSAVLQRTHESITMLRQIVSATGESTSVKKELYEAVHRVLFCLDTLADLLLTPGGSGEDDSQLRLLQQECASAELETLAELLSKVKSETGPALLKDEPDAYSCLTCLQDCLYTVQLVSTFPHNQLTEHPGIKNQHQELFSSQLCLLDEFELGQSEIFPSLKDAPSLECVLGRHLRESPGEKAKLQHASRSLLQGIARLLELGEECITEGQMSQVHNCSKLQTILCRHKKLLQVLGSQLAYVQHLFQHEPEALKCQEDERVQLEVRAKALQQQALEQKVASQRRLLEWTRWEDNCGRLGRVLDECEAFISNGAPEGDDDEEMLQHRLNACQQMLVQLDESRTALGRLLDDERVLQTEPLFAASVGQAGGALELRWRSVSRRTEQEIQRCRDIQDTQARFQTDFALLSERLLDASKPLKTLSDLADASDLSQECVHGNLTKLLDFSIQVEAMSVLKASVFKDGTRLLQLWEADCPGLRTQLNQLEVSWNRLTSDHFKIQEQLQQHLLAAQPPVELLSDLEDRLKTMEAQLEQEKERVLKATNAAEINEVLQHYQVLQAAVANGQLLLDFLCQPAPQMVGADIQSLRSERTVFSEKLGTFRLKWQHFQRQLKNQICGAEQIHHNCAGRERHLQCLRGWIEHQKIQLNLWKQPTSQTLAHKALLEWEAVVGRVKEVASAVQELQTRRVHGKKGEEHPSDATFSTKAESTSHACRDLSQQMEVLRPVLQRAVDDWSCFHRNLKDVILHTTRVRCALQHQQAPCFSLKQAEGYLDLLQQLQREAGKGEELWTALDQSYPSLVQTLHPGAAQALHDQVEGERKRWNDIVQEIKYEYIKTGETRSLWQKYTRLSDNCSVHLQNLWHQWEKLSSSSFSPEQNTQDTYSSVKKFQEAAEDLQGRMGQVLAVSKPLTGQLELLPANLIQSETRLLSRDILLLNQAMSRKGKSIQAALDQQQLFHTRLEAIEKQIQNLKHKSKDIDSVKQVLLELSDLYLSVAEIRDMSSYMTLTKQETERLHTLSRDWVESMTSASDMNRMLQAECQHSLSFQEKCKNLTSIQDKLKQESVCRKPPSYSSVQEMLTVHQRRQVEIIAGHQLLQGLLCDAVRSMEKETGAKRFELMAQVACMKESWFNSIALARQNQTLTKEQLHHWRIYHCGLKLLRKLLTDVDSLLPPTGPSLCTLQQLQNCANNYQCAEQSLGLHSPVYTQTLEAGKHLCETMTEPESQNRLQSELQAIEEAWEQSSSLVRRRRDLVDNTVQMWSECQDGITNIMSELNELKLKPPLPEGPVDSEEEVLIQETELSLQRLAGGLKELATMKTDLSQYVVASDSALLEQQLEQLHSQWEELCMKVSLHRQEIADRLNAWTIFNDKNREFCDWLTQMENKVCQSGDLSIEEMVEKLKKDCMEEINLFSENKSHLKQLGEQLLLASDEAKQSQVHGSLQEVNQRWHNLFHHIEARVKKLKETLVTVQQLDKNMSNLRSWLSRIEAELSRPITYSVCHEQEIQRRLAEQQELQRDIEQHTEGIASVLSLCDVLLRDEDAAGGTEAESDSLQETSRSLDQRWRTICAMALDRRLRIEETWTLWCKFLNDYSRFEDWLKMAEKTAANPNSADVLFTVAKEELKKFEGFQRQVHERLTQLELVNNQYRRLARENRTDRASQLKAMVHEGNRRWDTLHRRVAAILRRLKYFTSQREEFEGTRESMLVWLTELDLQLTNVEHFSESDVHHKIQQLNSFQKEITLNTERIDGLIVFGEGLIQRSSPQDAALIEDELEELHSYCQEVFSRLVRFHQRLSHPTIREEPELSATTFSLESSLELIGRPWLGRNLGSLPATPTHLLTSPLERSGRETPVSVDSLPLEWDHTGDVGGSSSHEDDEEEEGDDEEGPYFSALSVSNRSMVSHEPPRWRPPANTETQLDTEEHPETPTLTSTPLKQNYLRLMSQCSGSIENIKRVSLILDDEEQPEDFGLTGLTVSDKQSGVIERWELLQAQSRCNQQVGPQEPQPPSSDLDDITSWLENVIPDLKHLKHSDPATSIEDMEARAKELKEMQKTFAHYKSIMLSVNLRAEEAPELQDRLTSMNRDWSRVCTGLQQWDSSLRKTLMRCQEFHETLHSLLLWLAHAESRRYAVDISHPDVTVRALQQHSSTLTDLREELRGRQAQQASLQALWSQLQPENGAEESDEAQEKLHVTGSKLKLLLRQVEHDLSTLQQRLDCESASAVEAQNTSSDTSQESVHSKQSSSSQREMRDSAQPRSFFYRVLRAAFPLQLLFLLLLLLPCLIPMSESDPSCTVANNFARSFYPMLHYTNGPPPT